MKEDCLRLLSGYKTPLLRTLMLNYCTIGARQVCRLLGRLHLKFGSSSAMLTETLGGDLEEGAWWRGSDEED